MHLVLLGVERAKAAGSTGLGRLPTPILTSPRCLRFFRLIFSPSHLRPSSTAAIRSFKSAVDRQLLGRRPPISIVRQFPSMKLAVGIEQVRNNPNLYIGDWEPSGRFLGTGLAGCALTSGARRVQVELLDDGWVSVSAECDWITPSLPERYKDWPLSRVVVSLIPQVGGRQNEIRYEVIVAAFSQSLALKTGDHWISAVGDAPPDFVRERVADAEFALLFRPKTAGD
jgi:hypothetical protein